MNHVTPSVTSLYLFSTVSKGIIDAHGWELSVHSDGEGLGSKFIIEMDCVASPDNIRTVRCTSAHVISSHHPNKITPGDVTPPLIEHTSEMSSRRSGSSKISIGHEESTRRVSAACRSRAQSTIHLDNSTLFERSVARQLSDAAEEICEEKKCQASNQLRVLIVDDAPLNRKMLSRLMMTRGAFCVEASNGAEGLEKLEKSILEKRPFHVVMMDSCMPVMDGPTAAHLMREIGFRGMILGVTGNMLPEDITYFRTQGANEVLAKPLNIRLIDSFLAGLSL